MLNPREGSLIMVASDTDGGMSPLSQVAFHLTKQAMRHVFSRVPEVSLKVAVANHHCFGLSGACTSSGSLDREQLDTNETGHKS